MADDMNAREYSTHAREPRDAGRVARVMAEAARLAGDGRGRFLAPALLQSWPGIVHGGGLVALLGAAACSLAPRPAGPLRLEGRLTSSVPIETALDLEGHAEDGVATVTILERAQPLTSASVERVEATEDAVPSQWTAEGRAGARMPFSDQCLACGAHNPLGLRLGLAFDDDGVWARFEPPAPVGSGHPREDHVAVQHLVHLARLEEEVVAAVLGPQEPEAVRVAHDLALDEPRARRGRLTQARKEASRWQ